MFKYTLLYLFLSSYLIGLSLTCSCIQTTIADDFKDSTLVFIGRVLSITPQDMNLIVKLRVNTIFKGAEDIREISVETCSSSACCGFTFVKGRNYAVFARGSNPYTVSLCSSTTLINNNVLKQLRKLAHQS
jgi:hypothetical protein